MEKELLKKVKSYQDKSFLSKSLYYETINLKDYK